MQYTNDDKEVVKAFMECRQMKSYRCKTDGQSFWSGDIRVAEHFPYGDGTASTIVYDFTDRGGFFVDKQVQWHVIQLRTRTSQVQMVKVFIHNSLSQHQIQILTSAHGTDRNGVLFQKEVLV